MEGSNTGEKRITRLDSHATERVRCGAICIRDHSDCYGYKQVLSDNLGSFRSTHAVTCPRLLNSVQMASDSQPPDLCKLIPNNHRILKQVLAQHPQLPTRFPPRPRCPGGIPNTISSTSPSNLSRHLHPSNQNYHRTRLFHPLLHVRMDRQVPSHLFCNVFLRTE